MQGEKFSRIYQVLLERFGHQGWWPASSAFEVVVGAVLTQNTNWQNVERAIRNLRKEDALTPSAIQEIDEANLQELIRPAGYFRQKAARLKRVSAWLLNRNVSGADLTELKDAGIDELRRELLSIRGIGPETADSILLYALDMPVFVVDTYTVRIFARHELIIPEMGYAGIQEEFESRLPKDVEMYKDYHAQLVRLGKEFCKKSRPRCDECPLLEVLGPPIREEF